MHRIKALTLLMSFLLSFVCIVISSFTLTPRECDAACSIMITTPVNGSNIPYGTDFPVSANITTTLFTTNIDTWIEIVGNASLVSGDTDGTPDTYNHFAGLPGTFTPDWILHCDEAGDVTITIYAEITEPDVQPVMFSDTITIHQLKPHLVVTISEPANGTQFTAGSSYDVVAQVANTGNADAYGVSCTASITGNASSSSNLTQSTTPVNISAGSTGTVTWNMQCTGVGDVSVLVDAAGYTNEAHTIEIPQANIDSDSVTLKQIEMTTTVQRKPSEPDQSYSSSNSPTVYNWPFRPKVVVTYLSAQPQQVAANQPVIISGNVANRGETPVIYTATLKINGEIEETREGTLAANTAKPLEFTVFRSEPGTYTVDINGQKTYFTIIGTESIGTSDSRIALILLLSLMIATIAGLSIVLVRRSSRS